MFVSRYLIDIFADCCGWKVSNAENVATLWLLVSNAQREEDGFKKKQKKTKKIKKIKENGRNSCCSSEPVKGQLLQSNSNPEIVRLEPDIGWLSLGPSSLGFI